MDYAVNRLVDDLPSAIGLTASCAVTLLLLSAHNDRLLEFAAVSAIGGRAITHGREGARIAALWVVPSNGLAHRCVVCRVLSFLKLGLVSGIKRGADFVTQPAAQCHTCGGRDHVAGAFTDLVAEQAACGCTAERTDGLLLAPALALAGGERQQRHECERRNSEKRTGHG
jgi:hypothetical protein